MWLIVTDGVALSVCPSVTIVSAAKLAELIEMPFGVAYWLHLANKVESSICGGDVAFCQITLTSCS